MVVWDASRAPVSFQIHPRHSRTWVMAYAKRSSVDRANSLLKNPHLIQVKEKTIRVRGLVKFALMVALACRATKLHLVSLPMATAGAIEPRTYGCVDLLLLRSSR